MTKQCSLATNVAGIKFPSCIYNASGPRTGSSAAMGKIAASASGGVLAKSATIVKQVGNPQPRTWHSTNPHVASLNSEGLPNAGIEYYVAQTTIVESMGENLDKKPYMVSISGKTLQDNLQMISTVEKAIAQDGSMISALELNLACPNVIGKPIIGYDFGQLEQVLEAVCKCPLFQKLPLGLKLPPYLDGPHFDQVARIINMYEGTVKYVASINTIGNALSVDAQAEMTSISSNGGFAGLSGPAVKYTALANVHKLRQLLKPSIDVVGVGGVQSGTDAFEMLLCGASAVQVGTCHWIEGPSCFDRICKELEDLMTIKGYTSIADFQGKLKPWSKEGAAKSREARQSESLSLPTATTKQIPVKSVLDSSLVNLVLLVIIAMLLADKFGVVSFS